MQIGRGKNSLYKSGKNHHRATKVHLGMVVGYLGHFCTKNPYIEIYMEDRILTLLKSAKILPLILVW